MNADTAELCKRRFWTRGHSSQVLESTVDGSKYQAKLRLQLNDEMIGTMKEMKNYGGHIFLPLKS